MNCPLCGFEFDETAMTCASACPMAAVQGCNLQVLGLLSFLTPPLSVGLQALVSGRALGLHHLAGLALILAGAAWGGRKS